MSGLKAIERCLKLLETWLLSSLVLVLVALSFLQVLLRAFFSSGLLWSDTFLRHLVLWIGFLGAALATSEEKHFAMDMAARKFQGRGRALVQLMGYAASTIVSAILSEASWSFFLEEYKARAIVFSIGDVHVRAWIFEAILPIGFALVAFHALVKMLESVCELKR